MTTTLTFVAHQDDDLIFMNPDVMSDEQAGYNVWIVYLTAGQDDGGIEYAEQRVAGALAAHARAARKPNQWHTEVLQYASHQVMTKRLSGTNIRLIFTYILAASGNAGDPVGDLKRMWFDPTFKATPIDRRSAYTRDSLLAMIQAVISAASPDYMRTQDTSAYAVNDHVDHITGALFVAEADTSSRRTVIRRDEYYDYAIRGMPTNVPFFQEKKEVFKEYVQHDHAAGDWLNYCDRQYRRKIYDPGDLWVPRPYDFEGGLFTDADGWNQPQYYETIQTTVFNNQLMLLARGAGDSGLLVYQWDDRLKKFDRVITTGLFTDADGWNQPQYYETIQTTVFNNQLMLLARDPRGTGLLVYRWEDGPKEFLEMGTTGLFTDADGWNQPQYYETIQTAIFNNQLMLLTRGAGDTGLLVYQWDDRQEKFDQLYTTGLFTDADGWNQPQYYKTIQTPVFNNQLMLLTRGAGNAGLLPYQWDGTTNMFW